MEELPEPSEGMLRAGLMATVGLGACVSVEALRRAYLMMRAEELAEAGQPIARPPAVCASYEVVEGRPRSLGVRFERASAPVVVEPG